MTVLIHNKNADKMLTYLHQPENLMKEALFTNIWDYTWFPQPFSRTFLGQKYHFKDIVHLKIINQDMCEKAYHIYSMYDQLLNFLWYSLLLNPSSCLIHPLLFTF